MKNFGIVLSIILIGSITFFLSENYIDVYSAFTINKNQNEVSESSENAAIILINQKYKSDRFSDQIIGQVLNMGSGSAEFVKVIASLYDEDHTIIGTQKSYADPSFLIPGQKAPFILHINEETGDEVETYEISISWKNTDGSESYVDGAELER